MATDHQLRAFVDPSTFIAGIRRANAQLTYAMILTDPDRTLTPARSQALTDARDTLYTAHDLTVAPRPAVTP